VTSDGAYDPQAEVRAEYEEAKRDLLGGNRWSPVTWVALAVVWIGFRVTVRGVW
jgi:hypothetical protein